MTSGIPEGRAPVRPRVRSPFSGEVVLLEDEIEDLLREDRKRIVFLVGPRETGKRTALAHLRDRYPSERDLTLRSHVDLVHDSVPEGRLILFAVERRLRWFNPEWIELPMVPWGLDEALEYLEARHPVAKDGVMRRVVSADDGTHLHGEPVLWCAVLDALASDASLGGVRAALLRCIEAEISGVSDREALALWALREIGARYPAHDGTRPPPEGLSQAGLLARSNRALYDWLIEEVLAELRAGRLDLLSQIVRPCPVLMAELGVRIAKEPRVHELLRTALLDARAPNRAVLASLVHVHDAGWIHEVVPVTPGTPRLDLRHAILPRLQAAGAKLVRVRLEHAELFAADLLGADMRGSACEGVNLGRADLTGARLDGVDAEGAVLREATLAQASLRGVDLSGADLRGADLHRACLDGARLEHADLREVRAANATFELARFGHARLDGADLRDASLDGAYLVAADLHTATLRGARLCGTRLAHARLDGLDLTGAPMRASSLFRAELTATRLAGADLRGATLDEARMAFVDLERADLRSARLRRAVFHLGSSRSGMVFSDIASEGTRTGFYTDDDQHLDSKPIEEIRKANFRGADLRGAFVFETDWYLVDLRDAQYDPIQEQHFRRCRAILADPVAG